MTAIVADQERLRSFERRMAVPLLVSALLPIVLTMAGTDSVVATCVLVVTWFVFVLDLAVHVRLVPGYLRSRPGRFDLVIVTLTAPWFLIPGLGATRFLALARLGRLARIAWASGGGVRKLARQLGQVGIVTGLLILTCAYVAYGAEREVNEGFSTFGDSLWWATVTITTVGYGDIYPVTTNGRLAGEVLMFSGLAVLGVLAGSLSSFFGLGTHTSADPEHGPPAEKQSSPAEVAELRARLVELDRAVAAVREQLD